MAVWVVHRRRTHVQATRCLFQCELGSEEGCNDCIEHYARCIVVRMFVPLTHWPTPHKETNQQGFLSLHASIARKLEPRELQTSNLSLFCHHKSTIFTKLNNVV